MPVGEGGQWRASRDQDGGPSNSTINIYDLTEKIGDCEQSSLIQLHVCMPTILT